MQRLRLGQTRCVPCVPVLSPLPRRRSLALCCYFGLRCEFGRWGGCAHEMSRLGNSVPARASAAVLPTNNTLLAVRGAEPSGRLYRRHSRPLCVHLHGRHGWPPRGPADLCPNGHHHRGCRIYWVWHGKLAAHGRIRRIRIFPRLKAYYPNQGGRNCPKRRDGSLCSFHLACPP